MTGGPLDTVEDDPSGCAAGGTVNWLRTVVPAVTDGEGVQRTVQGEETVPPREVDPEQLQRPSGAGFVRWVVLEGDRLFVTGAMQTGVLVTLLALGSVWQFEMLDLMTQTRAVQDLLNTLLGGIVLLVSIVVSINSVVLSQEVSTLGTKHEQISESTEFRRELEEFSERGVAPVDPSQFLDYVLVTVYQSAEGIRTAGGTDSPAAAEIEDLVSDVDDKVEQVYYTMRTADGRVQKVLLSGLNYEYSRQINTARRILETYDEELTAAERESLEDLIEAMRYFGAGREYLKSLFIKDELAKLSTHLLYAALPTIVFTSYVLLAVDAGIFPPQLIPGIPRLMSAVSLAYVVALTPYTLLTAYVIRIASVARRSLATGPFHLDEDPEWDEDPLPDD